MAIGKPWEKSLWKVYDPIAKEVSCEFLETRGFKLEVPFNLQPEAYKKWDYIIRDSSDGQNRKIECEVKNTWQRSGEWENRFPTIDIPYRKKDSEADCYIVINKFHDSLAFILGPDVKAASTSPKNSITRFTGTRTEGELFFNVKLDKVRFFTKITGTWEEFKI